MNKFYKLVEIKESEIAPEMIFTVTKLEVFSHAPNSTTSKILWVKHGKLIQIIGKTIQIEFPPVWYWPFKKREWFHNNDAQYLINAGRKSI